MSTHNGGAILAQVQVKLQQYIRIGIGPDELTTPQNCNLEGQAYYWASGVEGKRTFIVVESGDAVKLRTKKGSYMLKKHDQLNIYTGECNGIKVHVVLKKMVGTVIFWPKAVKK